MSLIVHTYSCAYSTIYTHMYTICIQLKGTGLISYSRNQVLDCALENYIHKVKSQVVPNSNVIKDKKYN